MSFVVSVDNAIDGGFQIDSTVNDRTATTADGDYVDNDATLTFVGGAGEFQTITVVVNGDNTVEADETFSVALGAISNLMAGINPAAITVAGSPQGATIVNDDTATVTLAPISAVATEGAAGTTTTLTYSVTLDVAVQGGFRVAYATNDGTATTADGDYVDNDGTLTFAGTTGETQTITVVVNGDGDGRSQRDAERFAWGDHGFGRRY